LEADSLALFWLYNSTNGANWINNTNWLTGPVSTWFGVTVSEDRVSQLGLNFNGLSGPMPADLGDLTGLTLLDLGRNAVSGEIPAELGNLTQLTILGLGTTELSGSIPPELGNLASLMS